MTDLRTVHLELLEPHPRNVRRDDTPDEELVASISEQGVLQPLGVVEHEDGYMVVAGHRRLQAARAAALSEVPVIVHHHLDTDEKVIEAMLVENGRRADLTPVEEAAGYEQLTLAGYDVDAIAKATGRAESTVRERLKVAKLPKPAQDAAHVGQITLQDAARLGQLEEDPELLDEVVATIGSTDFGWRLANAVNSLARRRENAARAAAAKEAGLTLVEDVDGRPRRWHDDPDWRPHLWLHYNQREEDHEDYVAPTGYHVGADGHVTMLVPRDAQHQLPTMSDAERAEQAAQMQREREEREQAAQERAAAAEVRRESLRAALAGTKVPKALTELLRIVLPQWVAGNDAGVDFLSQVDALGESAYPSWDESLNLATTYARARPATDLLVDVVAFLASDVERIDARSADTQHEVEAVRDYVAWLEKHSHPVSSIEKQWLADVDEVADRLTAEAGDDEAEVAQE